MDDTPYRAKAFSQLQGDHGHGHGMRYPGGSVSIMLQEAKMSPHAVLKKFLRSSLQKYMYMYLHSFSFSLIAFLFLPPAVPAETRSSICDWL